jgi:hypothetical protein
MSCSSAVLTDTACAVLMFCYCCCVQLSSSAGMLLGYDNGVTGGEVVWLMDLSVPGSTELAQC